MNDMQLLDFINAAFIKMICKTVIHRFKSGCRLHFLRIPLQTIIESPSPENDVAKIYVFIFPSIMGR